ncbi:MAG TPA: DinB family protein [Caldimonas sp.]|nr:DinB family protein [Caldimonas sp.]
MRAVDLLRTAARANRLANRRLHAAMAPLSDADFQAPRTSFFPSLAGTLNHILAVDAFYLAALHRERDMEAQWRAFVPANTLAELAPRQADSDQRLIRFVDALDDAGCEAEIVLDRGSSKPRERVAHVLTHLAMHQTHHRGQVHAMLSGTAVKPPQLDEFLMPSDAHLREADMHALGWAERELFGA